jgi:LSD1 subclass zinc finger protein
MTIVTCPGCTRQLQIPENAAGKVVRCPACQLTFAVATRTAPPIEKLKIIPAGRKLGGVFYW